MKMNEIYEAPMLEVLNVMVESGFAASPSDTNSNESGVGFGDTSDDILG